ncbi:Pentatricopeptide repeat-containing protein [Paramyrothecium foliicola]|nr:Pentatricopeptide repeat-containing protein [Paramyrothecium foliicola]
MLERTAATLEACNLQRVLPRQAPSTKTCRQLHTGFWQHGASALEVWSSWPALPRAADVVLDDASSSQQPTGLVASIFLLDFLYPKSTHSLLRRIYPRLPGCHNPNHSIRCLPRRRHLASSAAEEENTNLADDYKFSKKHYSEDLSSIQQPGATAHHSDPTNSANASLDVASTSAPYPSRDSRGEQGRQQIVSHQEDGLDQTASTPSTLDAVIQQAQHEVVNLETGAQTRSAAQLSELLSPEKDQDYHQIWDLYCQLDKTQQSKLRPQVIQQFSHSKSVVEMGRAVTLFRQVPADKWDNELLAAGVQLYLRSQNAIYAANRLKLGFENGLYGGLDELLTHVVSRQHWTVLVDVWLAFHTSDASLDPIGNGNRRIPKLDKLPQLENLGEKYIAFEQYLALEGVSIRHSDTTSQQALDVLRRKLGKLALRQPCPPPQASVILKALDERHTYYEYLTYVLHRRKYRSWSAVHTQQLADIYQEYRKMPGAKPSVTILKGLFKTSYPTDSRTLMTVYGDWHKTYGDLDQWAYERFLTYFASMGDVATVQDLWKRYTSQHKDILRKPSTYYSLMNVYAQVGDVASATEELKLMKEKYRAKPDLDIMNTLLKCYVKADDYEGALQCFQTIRESFTVDSYTMAHVMTMCAKKGDLAKTLELFELSQKERIPVSKEMVLALVLVYCHNDRLMEAEKICIELAERKVTSSVIWNQLIHFNGMHGKLHDCYRLLQKMKRYKLEWDQVTHEYLFEAMVKVHQIQGAFSLLKRAQRNRLFVVNPNHYAIIMVGAARLKDRSLVNTIAAHMQQAGLEMNFNGHVAFMKSYLDGAPDGDQILSLSQGLLDQLQAMVPKRGVDGELSDAHRSATESLSIGDPRVLFLQTQQLSRAILMMVDLGKYEMVEEMVDLYTAMFPSYKFADSLPPDVASAIMVAYWKRNSFKRLTALWQKVWRTALRRNRNTNGEVYSKHEFDLNRPIYVMMSLYRKTNDGEALLACIQQATTVGFKLTAANWEKAVRYLAEMGQWEAAVQYCETILMPMWGGWRRGKRSLETRQSLRNARAIRPPSKEVLLSLQEEWLQMRRLAAWSPEISAKLKNFAISYPRVHYALLSAASKNMLTTARQASKQEIYAAIQRLIVSYSTKELKIIRFSLMRQLYSNKAKQAAQDKRVFPVSRARVAATGAEKSLGSTRGRELALYHSIRRQISAKEGKTRGLPLHEQQVEQTSMQQVGTLEKSQSPILHNDVAQKDRQPAARRADVIFEPPEPGKET